MVTRRLCVCGRELRATCPSCGKLVLVSDDKYAPHEHGYCTGSHMEYKTCKQSGKFVQQMLISQKED